MADKPLELKREMREKFLAALATCGNVTQAAKIAGVSREWARLERSKNEEFAAGWLDALDQAADHLEEEAQRRAVEGWLEPAISAGKWVHDENGEPAYVRRYSDRLLEVLLRGARPAKYRDRGVTVTGQVDHHVMPSQSAAALAKQLLAQVGDNPEARDAISKAFLALAAPVVDADPA